jgi:hypothetical protein
VALLASATALTGAPAWAGPSVYLTAPDDPAAVKVKGVGDGKADDSAAIQKALDAAYHRGGGSLVFLPSGRYRITRTLFVWPGVRLLGVGATRPVLMLADNTPGFQQGVKNMLFFTGSAPATANEGQNFGQGVAQVGAGRKPPYSPPGTVPATDMVADANSGTFYSAMANIDIKVGKGNPATAAIREHAAQHAFLKHMDFDLGSALAGVFMVGNEGEDLHFRGGRYGILTEKPSPAWSYTLLDSSFEGQRDAAIREHEAGLTLSNVTFRNVPVGIEVDEGYGDWLYGQDVRFENVSKAGVIVSNENNVYTQVSFDNAIAINTPVFARLRSSGRTVGQKGSYKVAEFTYGLTLPAPGAFGTYETRYKAEPLAKPPAPVPDVVRDLPPTSQWANVKTLGAKGDGKSDDTAALQAAIDSNKALYFPSGFYAVTDTLKLRPDTVLIGLNPSSTQIILPDGVKAFEGVGAPRALIEAPKGGDNIVSGLGLYTGGGNGRATALLWKAGAASLVDDVKIQGGHGTELPGGARFDPYALGGPGTPDLRARWDKQRHSIWVTDGGGGTFANVWSPNTDAQSGFYVSDTTTPGRVFQLSNEHHGRVEIGLDRVANWQFLAPQTEEEVIESAGALSLSIRNSRNILIANYHGYRVTRTLKPAPMAVRLENVDGIRFRNVHVNAESGLGTCDRIGCTTFLRASKFPYENAIVDVTHGIEVREREFAVLDVNANPAPVAAQGPAVTKLADDFWSISSGAVGPDGKLWFVERQFNRIYNWSEAGGLRLERDTSLAPVNLAVDKSGNVLVLSSEGLEGTVYSFKPGSPEQQLTLIAPTEDVATAASIAIPVNWWNNGEFKDQYDPATDHFTTLAEMFARDMAAPNARHYVSPDGSLVLPAWRTLSQGPWRWSPAMQTYGFITARPGERLFVTNESENKTYSGTLGAGGSVTDLKPFANRGGESVAQGPDGRVYVANGQVFVYAADGKETGRIDVPERPLQLLFGGADKRTLYILTHHALYSVRP